MWSNVFMIAGLQRGRDAARARRRGRHRHDGDPARRRRSAPASSRPPARRRSWSCCRELGADVAINYRDEDFVDASCETDGRGADVILDNMGAKYLGRNVAALAHRRAGWSCIGMQGGTKGELDLGTLLGKRGSGDRDVAARPARRGEGRDLRGRARARLAADRRGSGDRPVHRARSRWPRPAGRTALMDSGVAHRQDHAGRRVVSMSSPSAPQPPESEDQIVVIGPDGRPVAVPASAGAPERDDEGGEGGERNLTDLVEQPAKVMRIGTHDPAAARGGQGGTARRAPAAAARARSCTPRSASSRTAWPPSSTTSSTG